MLVSSLSKRTASAKSAGLTPGDLTRLYIVNEAKPLLFRLPLQPNTPVLAIGASLVTFSSLQSYRVGGGNITYELTERPKAGLYIYVTEHLTSVWPLGSVITPGEDIAIAQPGN